MAEIQNKPHKITRSNTTCFFGCFGYSGDDDEAVVGQIMSPEKGVDSGREKKPGWFSWLMFRMKRSPTKTVPLDSTGGGSSHKATKYRIEARASSKAKSDKLTTLKRQPPSQIPASKSDQDVIEEADDQQTKYDPEQTAALEDRNRRHFDSARDDTCQERMLSLGRKLHSKKTGRSHPGSPESKFTSSPITAVMTSRSASIPVGKKREKQRRGNASIHHSEASHKTARKYEAVAGMSIIMVTLMIMILCGRVCAILCTSAWFYSIPRLRTAAGVEIPKNVVVKNHPNLSQECMDSNEYKQKVVLEGFLERNHRRY